MSSQSGDDNLDDERQPEEVAAGESSRDDSSDRATESSTESGRVASGDEGVVVEADAEVSAPEELESAESAADLVDADAAETIETIDAVDDLDEVDDSIAEAEEAEEAEAEEAEAEEAEAEAEEAEAEKLWYILKVQVNREDSIRDALMRRVKIAGLDEYFEEVVVPTEDVAEYNKSGKRRIVKRKLYPGYLMVHMVLNDDTWFMVRETPGIGDFTGSAGKPTPMEPREVQRIMNYGRDTDSGEAQVKTAIPFKMDERVRVKEGNFLNFEGEVSAIDEANGRVTVMINIFGRSTPVELEHWQIESV